MTFFMPRIFIFLIFFLLLIFQLTIAPRLSFFGVFPNIILATLLVLAVLRPSAFILILAFLAGLMLDIFSSQAFGIYLLSFVIMVWLMLLVGQNVFKINDWSGQISLILCGCLFGNLLIFFAIKIFSWFGFGNHFVLWSNFFRRGLPEAGLDILVVLILLFIFKKAHGLFARI